jgi:hypothetical protein
MLDPKRRRLWVLGSALSFILALLVIFFVPLISMLPPTEREVREWEVDSGSVQVDLTIAQWIRLAWRYRGS